MGVLQAAELGALTSISAGVVRGKCDRIDLTGNQILLAAKIWDPKAMDHISRLEREFYRATDGEVDFIRRLKNPGWLLVTIGDLPPPLVSSHFDIQCVAGGS